MTEEARLPAKLEIGALIRMVGNAGGFASVLHSGEAEAGTIVVVLTENGANLRVYERMPRADGAREWQQSKAETDGNRLEIDDYLVRRASQDRDLWIVELDIANGERFIGLKPSQG